MWHFKSKLSILLSAVIIIPLTSITPAIAADQYTIEVLVFKPSNSAIDRNSSGNEIWKVDSERTLSNLIPQNKIVNKSKNSKNNLITFKTGIKLARYLRLLKKSPNYQIIKYISWRQSPLNKRRSPKVPFSSNFEDNSSLPGKSHSDLEGFVKFYLGTFLQLEVDLTYSPQSIIKSESSIKPESPDDVTQDSTVYQGNMAMQQYSIRERRRVKIDEINYFDHPQFGIFAVVFPSGAKKK